MKIVRTHSFFSRKACCHITYFCRLRYKTYVIIIIIIDQLINQCNDLQYFPMTYSYCVSLLMVQGIEQVAVHT